METAQVQPAVYHYRLEFFDVERRPLHKLALTPAGELGKVDGKIVHDRFLMPRSGVDVDQRPRERKQIHKVRLGRQ